MLGYENDDNKLNLESPDLVRIDLNKGYIKGMFSGFVMV